MRFQWTKMAMIDRSIIGNGLHFRFYFISIYFFITEKKRLDTMKENRKRNEKKNVNKNIMWNKRINISYINMVPLFLLVVYLFEQWSIYNELSNFDLNKYKNGKSKGFYCVLCVCAWMSVCVCISVSVWCAQRSCLFCV